MKLKKIYEIKTRADMRSADNQVFCLADRSDAYQLQIVGASQTFSNTNIIRLQ